LVTQLILVQSFKVRVLVGQPAFFKLSLNV
jgi:hypothetical protein